MTEVFTYKHKKFDHQKRARDETTSLEDYAFNNNDMPRKNNNNTPISINVSDTSSSSDYQYSTNINDLSTTLTSSNNTTATSPTLPYKRRRLNNDCNDSGIYLTPKKIATNDLTIMGTPKFDSNVALPRFTSTPLKAAAAVANMPPASPIATALTATTISPTAAILPRISNATLQNICKYHGNMVRKFPKIERTPKDQERRNKNTLACRMSRRVKKLEHIAVEEQYKEFSVQHMEIVEASMRAAAYLNELMLRLANVNGEQQQYDHHHHHHHQQQQQQCVAATEEKPKVAQTAQPKPFSIEYLTRNAD